VLVFVELCQLETHLDHFVGSFLIVRFFDDTSFYLKFLLFVELQVDVKDSFVVFAGIRNISLLFQRIPNL